MRRIIYSFVLIFGLIVLLPPNFGSASSLIKVQVDQQELSFDQPPIEKSGRVLVPLRAIFETLGASVSWDAQTETVTATKGNKVITLKIGSRVARINGSANYLDQAAIELNGRTLVPVRFISESLGEIVNWDNNTQTVIITTPVDLKISAID
jgi:trimeric autotransporter adhesin